MGHEVALYKSHCKGLLSKWKFRSFGPFIVNKVFVGGALELTDPEDAHTFVVKGNKLNT